MSIENRKPPKFSNTLLSKKNNSLVYRVYYSIMALPFFYKNKTKIKYVVVGLLGEIVDFSLLYILTTFAGIFYLFSATISYLSAIFFNFTLNRKYTFKFKSKNFVDFIKAMLQYFTVSFLAMIVNLFLLGLLVQSTNMNYMLAKLIVTLFLFVFIYLSHHSILKSKKL